MQFHYLFKFKAKMKNNKEFGLVSLPWLADRGSSACANNYPIPLPKIGRINPKR